MFVDEKQQGEVKPVQVGTLMLSTAIRIGASLGPQLRGGPYVIGTSSCALGAAMLGVGIENGSYGGAYGCGALEKKLPRLNDALNAFCGANGYPIQSANDEHGWSREQVADWLESHGY